MRHRKKNEYFQGIKKGLEEAIAWSRKRTGRVTIRTVVLGGKRADHGGTRRGAVGGKRTNGHTIIHPGEILALEFLEPASVSQYRLAQAIHVPPRRINEIVLGKRAITADTALRLGLFFGTSAQFWMNLQSRYELEIAEDRLGARWKREIEALV